MIIIKVIKLLYAVEMNVYLIRLFDIDEIPASLLYRVTIEMRGMQILLNSNLLIFSKID